MVTQVLDVAVERMPLIATTVIVSLLAWLVQRFLSRASLSHIPLAGAMLGDAEKRRKAYLAGAKNIYKEGYQKVRPHCPSSYKALSPSLTNTA